LFDRSLRRVVGKRRHRRTQEFDTIAEANAHADSLTAAGFEQAKVRESAERFVVTAVWTADEVRTTSQNVMPRGEPQACWAQDPQSGRYMKVQVPDWALKLGLDAWHYRDAREIPEVARKWLEPFRLFSIKTRHYLRRRAWRYFRRLGRGDPDRYLAAVTQALLLYRDEDTDSDLSLLDNWGLMHILFHGSSVVQPKRTGWVFEPQRSLENLCPAPIFEGTWAQTPRATVDLLMHAQSAAIVQWAAAMAANRLDVVRDMTTFEERLALLGHFSPAVISLAAELLRRSTELECMTVEQWLHLASSSQPTALEAVGELMRPRIDLDEISLAETVLLTTSPASPLAKLGFLWLQAKAPTTTELAELLPTLLFETGEPIRRDVGVWARNLLVAAEPFQNSCLLPFFASPDPAIRQEGWNWFENDPRAFDDLDLWRVFANSPFDDVRLYAAEHWRATIAKDPGGRAIEGVELLDHGHMCWIWASVLLGSQGEKGATQRAITLVVNRLRRHPREAALLLPTLAVAMSCAQGPAWRLGLAAVVRLLEGGGEPAKAAASTFPELQFV
jgi:hypothetical protein